MPTPTEEEENRALEEQRLSEEELDALMGSPLDHLSHSHIHWWEFVLAGVIVAAAFILAVLVGCYLINYLFRLAF